MNNIDELLNFLHKNYPNALIEFNHHIWNKLNDIGIRMECAICMERIPPCACEREEGE